MLTIGQRIKNRRIELNLSVEEVASKLGKNRATIYRYEKDDIKDLPITVLEPLAKVLETTPADLMGWNEEYDFKNAPSKSYSSFNNIESFKNAYSKSNFRKNTLEAKIIDNIRKLNNNGKKNLLDYSNILLGNPAFSSEYPSHLEVNAAHQSNGDFTNEERQEDEDMLD